jgi:syndecan 4
VKTQREETMLLRKALEDCEACKIKKPECTDLPYPCFDGPPRVDCRDTAEGTECGPCPPGYKVQPPPLPCSNLLLKGDGRFCELDACGGEPCYEGVSCYPDIAPPHYRCGPCPKVPPPCPHPPGSGLPGRRHRLCA